MAERPIVVLERRTGWVSIDFAELWRYRELAWTLALREILIRYKQSILGVAWAVIQPFMTMVVFTVLFSVLLGRNALPTAAGIPYAVSTYCALLPWQLFSQSVTRASLSIVNNQNLITKVYFPRPIIPLAPVLAALVDFVVAFAVFVLLMFWYHVTPGLGIFALPFLTLFAVLTALAMSLWLSALNALYRDIQHVVPFLVQILMYVSPILYSAQSVLHGKPSWITFLYWLNPLSCVAEGFRWALLRTPRPPGYAIACSVIGIAILTFSGLFVFKRIEKRFADVV